MTAPHSESTVAAMLAPHPIAGLIWLNAGARNSTSLDFHGKGFP
jgi:hypothetical protein